MTGIAADNIRGILLDIEGTTTSISFVYEVLFPYARQHVREFLQKHADDSPVRDVLARLREHHSGDCQQGLNPPVLNHNLTIDIDATVAYLTWLMDRDSKAEPLKALEGMIWEEGYNRGDVKGHIFPDVPLAFERWQQQGKLIAIFSSGSVLAQKLLFGRTTAGDLKPYIKNYFDTTTGPKRQARSYRDIADSLRFPAQNILFASDVTEELDAAAAAGMQTRLCIRPGNHPPPPSKHATIHSFDELP